MRLLITAALMLAGCHTKHWHGEWQQVEVALYSACPNEPGAVEIQGAGYHRVRAVVGRYLFNQEQITFGLPGADWKPAVGCVAVFWPGDRLPFAWGPTAELLRVNVGQEAPFMACSMLSCLWSGREFCADSPMMHAELTARHIETCSPGHYMLLVELASKERLDDPTRSTRR